MTPSFRTLLTFLSVFRSLRSMLGSRRPTRAGDSGADERLDRAAAARAAGRVDEARALFEQSLRLHPADAGRLATIHYEGPR